MRLGYLEHGLFHAAGFDYAISEEVLDELGVRRATGAPGHAGVEQEVGVCEEGFELGKCGLCDHIDGIV